MSERILPFPARRLAPLDVPHWRSTHGRAEQPWYWHYLPEPKNGTSLCGLLAFGRELPWRVSPPPLHECCPKCLRAQWEQDERGRQEGEVVP